MGPADLRRYHGLLLKKQREVSSALGEAQSRVPAAGGLQGDIIDQANADAEAELQIRFHRTDGRLARAIEEALGRIRQGTYGVCVVCKRPMSRARLEAVPWTNRLILGDSLQVMTSLSRREDLAGKVQMIYMDPPYGIFAVSVGLIVIWYRVRTRGIGAEAQDLLERP